MLGELFDLKYGFGLTAQNRLDGVVPVYGSSGIVGFNKTAAVMGPGIILGRKGNVGAVHYSPVPFYPIDTVYFIDETKKQSDLQFLYYLLSRVPFKRVGSDVGVPGLNRDLAYQLEIKLPEEPKEQKRIAGILAAFDEKIENNNRLIKKFEEIAQAIFKEWFVNFRFPGNEKVEYVDSSLGRVPKGWEVKRLDEISEVVDCLHTKKPERVAEGLVYLQLNNVGGSGLIDLNDLYFISEKDYLNWTKNIVLTEGDCVISNAGRVGAVAQIPPGFKGAVGRNLTAVRPQSVAPTYLLNYLLSTIGHQEIEYQTDSGSLFDSLNVRGIKRFRILVPNSDTMECYEKMAQPFRSLITEKFSENQKLAAMRDLLLPKLMSGEICI